MKKYFLGSLPLLLIVLVSCQKEIDWGLGGSAVADPLLIRTLQKTGTDSTDVHYSYNSSRQLTEENTTGVSAGTILDNDLKIYRNSSGIITRTVQVAASLVAAGVDSLVTLYHYDATAGKYSSAVFTISALGFTVTDSAVYTTDANGRITKDDHYLALPGFPYTPVLKDNYTYSADGNNMVSTDQSTYSITTSTYSLVSTTDYTFDAKTSPLRLNTKNEAIVLVRPALFSINNATQSQFTDATTPANNFSNTNVYTYNGRSRPDSAVSTRNPGAALSDIKYYYQ